MIKGRERKEFLSVDEIMDKSNGGYDIYMYYLGKVARVMSRPWGKKERKDSWGVFPRKNIWYWKDHANEESGNVIQFVEKYFNLSFVDACAKICWDFGWNTENSNPVEILWERPEEIKEYTDIRFSPQPFKKQHHDYWNAAEVDEQHCRKHECYAVKDLAINKKRINIGNEAVFAYYSPEEDGVKIYFTQREKADRFRNNVSYHYLWNYGNIKDCENLIVQKSVKDMIVTTLVTDCCIATQAEAVKIFNEDVVKMINTISRKPWIWYGSDWDGVKKCKEITDTNKWRYINTPKELLPDINDTYGYVKKFGIKKLEEFMKLKKLI